MKYGISRKNKDTNQVEYKYKKQGSREIVWTVNLSEAQGYSFGGAKEFIKYNGKDSTYTYDVVELTEDKIDEPPIKRTSLFDANEVKDTTTIISTSVKENKAATKPEQGYMVEVGTTRYGRKLYLAFFCDSDDFRISAVPSVGTKRKVDSVIKRAIEKYSKTNDKAFFDIKKDFNPVIVPKPDNLPLKIID